jgi:hypothetical protein
MPRDPIDTATASRERLRKKNPTGTATLKGDAADKPAVESDFGTTDLGSGKTARGGGADMPKQTPGESPGSYAERLRKWRAGRGTAANQAKALGGQ